MTDCPDIEGTGADAKLWFRRVDTFIEAGRRPGVRVVELWFAFRRSEGKEMVIQSKILEK